MSVQPGLTKDVLEHRRITHLRLLELFKRAGLGDSTDMVEWVVFDYHHTRFSNFFAQMAGMFVSAPFAVDRDAVRLVIHDLWYYFPHESLNGKSPAEVFDAGEPLGRWKTKPISRGNAGSGS
jgi:hypothetical protein